MRKREFIEKSFKKEVKGEFCYNANAIIVELLLDIRDLLKKRTFKRKASAWNLFVAEGIKQGKPIQQLAKEWKKEEVK